MRPNRYVAQADAMTDPYVTYDTFSLGNDPEGSPEASGVGSAPSGEKQLPPIFARLPRLEPAEPKPKTRQRFDEAESPLGAIHLGETGPLPTTQTELTAPPTAGFDPVATIRIDTVTPTSVDAPTEQPKPQRTRIDQGAPATIPFHPAETAVNAESIPSEPAADEPWATTLLELESTIQPYSRWIALAALIAAMGLTVVILQGSGVTIETDPTTPAQEAPDGAAFAESEPLNPVDDAGLTRPAIEPIEEAKSDWLRPLQEPGVAVAQTTPATVAAGPTSASRSPGRARLTGEVLAPPQERIDVADATHRAAYPETRR